MNGSDDQELCMSCQLRITTHDRRWRLLTLCFFASSFTKLITSKLAAESSPLVGSSRNKILGLVISCAATLTLLFWPPDTPLRIGVPMMVSAWSDRPNDKRSPSIRAFRSVLLTELWTVSCLKPGPVVSGSDCIPRQRQLSSKMQSLSDSKRANESILLLNVGAELPERSQISWGTVDSQRSLHCCIRGRSSVGEHVEKRRLPRSTVQDVSVTSHHIQGVSSVLTSGPSEQASPLFTYQRCFLGPVLEATTHQPQRSRPRQIESQAAASSGGL